MNLVCCDSMLDAISAALPWKVARPSLLPPIPLYSPLYRHPRRCTNDARINRINRITNTSNFLHRPFNKMLLKIFKSNAYFFRYFQYFFSTNLSNSFHRKTLKNRWKFFRLITSNNDRGNDAIIEIDQKTRSTTSFED